MLQAAVKQLRVPEATGDFTPIGWHLSDVVIDTIFSPKIFSCQIQRYNKSYFIYMDTAGIS